MIRELVTINIRAGASAMFEESVAEAKDIIAAAPGFDHLELRRCIEVENRYLLLIGWDRLEDHIEGFRGSPDYPRWRALLEPSFDSPPTVEHFELVARTDRPN